MGGQQSTRRVSIDNRGDPASVIKVSESVVERLKGGPEHQEELEEEESPKKNVRKPSFNQFRHVPVPENVPLQGLPYITSLDIQQVLETEIEKNNEYWEKRIDDLQRTQEKMNNIIEDEYVKVSKELTRLLPRLQQSSSPLPCQKGKAKVASCYKSNPHQTLNCAAEVEQFACCMTQTRIKLQEEGKLD